MPGPTVATPALSGPFLVDGHVHFHDCFDASVFFATAVRNLDGAARERGLAASTVGLLLFTEGPGESSFRALREGRRRPGSTWTFSVPNESCALLAWHGESLRLVLVAGRQIPTRERLEVLAVGCDCEFPQGMSLPDAVAAARQAGALPIIPWGFGKWWLGRGEVVAQLLEADPGPLFLGDNGGRPRFATEPTLFGRARSRGLSVLPGSDPLPFPNQALRVMRYGFVLPGSLDTQHPTRDILRLLLGIASCPEPFGRREGLPSVLRSQVMLRLRRRVVR